MRFILSCITFISITIFASCLKSSDITPEVSKLVNKCTMMLIEEAALQSIVEVEVPAYPSGSEGITTVHMTLKEIIDSLSYARVQHNDVVTSLSDFQLEISRLNTLKTSLPKKLKDDEDFEDDVYVSGYRYQNSYEYFVDIALSSQPQHEIFEGYTEYFREILINNPTKAGVEQLHQMVQDELNSQDQQARDLKEYVDILEGLAQNLRKRIPYPLTNELLDELIARRDSSEGIFSELPFDNEMLRAALISQPIP